MPKPKAGLDGVVARNSLAKSKGTPVPEDLLGVGVPDRRRRGRPLGSMDARTIRVAEWVLRQTEDPLLVVAKMAGMGVKDIAKALNCTLLEAWQEKRHCAAVALPYLHRKMPQAVDVTTRTPVYLTIHDGGADVVGVDDSRDVVTVIDHQDIDANGASHGSGDDEP